MRHGDDFMSELNGTPEAQTAGQVADAEPSNWVDSYAPARFRPYLRLSRMDRPTPTSLLLLPCWWGVLLAAAADQPRLFELWIIVGCTIGSFLMRGAGCTWNDIADRHVDAQVARTRSRPIPSGQVSVKGALIWIAVQCLISLCVLLTFNWTAIGLGVLALAPVGIYPFAKRFTWWPQVFLGLAFNWGILVGWVAHTGSLSWPPVILYVAGIAWTLFYDTIYAPQDPEDVALIGVKSTARLFGDNSKKWLRGFLVAAVALMAFAIIAALVPDANVLALTVALAGAWAFGWHMVWQLRRLDINDPENCLMLFRSNRDAGLIPVLFLAVAALL
jgi:4-hydroxybenzoate polyprenyltransferase